MADNNTEAIEIPDLSDNGDERISEYENFKSGTIYSGKGVKLEFLIQVF